MEDEIMTIIRPIEIEKGSTETVAKLLQAEINKIEKEESGKLISVVSIGDGIKLNLSAATPWEAEVKIKRFLAVFSKQEDW